MIHNTQKFELFEDWTPSQCIAKVRINGKAHCTRGRGVRTTATRFLSTSTTSMLLRPRWSQPLSAFKPSPHYLAFNQSRSRIKQGFRAHTGSVSPCSMERPAKRARVSPDSTSADAGQSNKTSTPLASLHRSITPPPRNRSQPSSASNAAGPNHPNDHSASQKDEPNASNATKDPPRIIPSPIQLTHIRDLPDKRGLNADTVKLRDILGDPMIRECWQFNYLFDVDFLMSHFDEDVRSLVQVKVVHGSWEREAPNRIRVEVRFTLLLLSFIASIYCLPQEACSRHPNVEAIVAYMPERFGTHHSKMMILLRHDDLAQ